MHKCNYFKNSSFFFNHGQAEYTALKSGVSVFNKSLIKKINLFVQEFISKINLFKM